MGHHGDGKGKEDGRSRSDQQGGVGPRSRGLAGSLEPCEPTGGGCAQSFAENGMTHGAMSYCGPRGSYTRQPFATAISFKFGLGLMANGCLDMNSISRSQMELPKAQSGATESTSRMAFGLPGPLGTRIRRSR